MAQPSATDQIISAGRQMLLKHNCVCCDRKTPQIHIAPSAAFDKVKDYLLWNQQIILNLNTSYWQLKQPIFSPRRLPFICFDRYELEKFTNP